MSKTLWLAFLFNFAFFVIFFLGSYYQNNLIDQAGIHLTWTSWSFYSFTIQRFNYQLGQQATYASIAPTTNAVSYPNIPSFVFWVYFFGNIGFLRELSSKENKKTKENHNQTTSQEAVSSLS
jgi:hypothetical protein